MKTSLALLLLATAAFAQAAALPAKITEQTKFEMSRGKGSVVLKAGTPIQVVSQDGDTLEVLYRNINGRVSRAHTDFKGEAPHVPIVAAQPVPVPAAPAPQPAAPVVAKPAETKPAETKPAEAKPAANSPVAPANPPTTVLGKAVQKARDTEAKHRENLVDPVNEMVDPKKQETKNTNRE
jgi:hypothetical protein